MKQRNMKKNIENKIGRNDTTKLTIDCVWNKNNQNLICNFTSPPPFLLFSSPSSSSSSSSFLREFMEMAGTDKRLGNKWQQKSKQEEGIMSIHQT